jgi:hypothetical protein
MNPEDVLKILEELRSLPYFPDDPAVMRAILRMAGSMCRNLGEVRWLVDRMTSGLYPDWPGPAEMRACFCSRFKPKDGITVCSTVFPDGLPPDPSVKRARIEKEEQLALPEGHMASADKRMEAAFQILVQAQTTKTVGFDQPATKEEIATAPKWLRKLEGYD